jgi:aldose 1-epimerase
VLGYDELEPYLEVPVYIGAAIGRYANRIDGGAFELNGSRYTLEKSDGDNTLHGGAQGFDKRVWRIEPGRSRNAVTLTHQSPDGEQGFPGALAARVTYALNDANELNITFTAKTDKPTIVCLTHHGYFNLAGEGSGHDIRDQVLTIAADAFTPVDETLIPTGELKQVTRGAFDFREPHAIGARIDANDEQLSLAGGYDHNFVLNKGRTTTPEFAARLEDPASGRALDILTTEPGLQFYSGNFLTGATKGKGAKPYVKYAGLCLEPQVFPDAPNQPSFPSARLDPGKSYRHVSVYRFTAKG